jgi:hypothetical protein
LSKPGSDVRKIKPEGSFYQQKPQLDNGDPYQPIVVVLLDIIINGYLDKVRPDGCKKREKDSQCNGYIKAPFVWCGILEYAPQQPEVEYFLGNALV